MLAVIFLARLDLEQKSSYMDGHSIGSVFDQINLIFKWVIPRVILVFWVRLEEGWMVFAFSEVKL